MKMTTELLEKFATDESAAQIFKLNGNFFCVYCEKAKIPTVEDRRTKCAPCFLPPNADKPRIKLLALCKLSDSSF